MKISPRITLLSVSFLASLVLTGCSGMVSGFPDTPAEISAGPIHGGVFGGHSPIVGAEIYVFQSGTTYKGPSVNKLTASDAQGTDPTHGAYVLTDSTGSFQVAGDYTCSTGYPVYLAAVGGTTVPGATLLHFTGTKKTKATIIFDTSNPPASGAQVSFASGAFTTSGYTALNGTTQTVTAAGTGTFSIANPTGKATAASATGYVLTGGLPNPAAVNIGVAGNCPGTANEFASTLPFVYISEVSTIAAANAFAGFGTGPYDVGSSSSNLAGIANAANTAGMMYNITAGGSALSSTHGGLYDQTHGTTSTGMVPQQELDTLGNILAACVDSGNTTQSPTSQCKTLFDNATSSGVANTGTIPTDIATAAFNIAAHPASNVATLYDLQAAGDAPFAPVLGSAPHDYTVTIAYSGGGLGATHGKSPHSVAVDATGNIYTVNYSGNLLNIFSPEGVPQSTAGYGDNGLNQPVSVAINSGSADVWIANDGSSHLSEFAATGAAGTGYSLASGASLLHDAEFDASGNLWVTSDGKRALYEVSPSGTGYTSRRFAADKATPYGVALDTDGYIWLGDESATEATECNSTGSGAGCASVTTGGIGYAVGNAIDSRNNVWFGNSNGTLSAFNEAGTALTKSPYVTGSGTRIDGVAIDGLDNIWAANDAGNALYEFGSIAGNGAKDRYTVTEITPSSGYSATSPDGIAIDGSGNVWYDSSATAGLYEVVGAANPVVTPIAKGVSNATLGSRP